MDDFERLRANVFWSTKEEVVVGLQEDLRVAHGEVSQLKERLWAAEEEVDEARKVFAMGNFFQDRAVAQMKSILYRHIRTVGGLALSERVLALEMLHRGQGGCNQEGCNVGCVVRTF